MRGPKILALVSSIDLSFRYGCTPAWWQLWKGLHEEGVDLVLAPYRGRPIESPWWRVADNPTYREGETFAFARDTLARLKGDTHLRRAEENPADGLGDRVTREVIWRWVTPRWRKHLERLVEREQPDAVIVFTVPMAHIRGIPTALRERFGMPVVFYDGDLPMSLPEFGGMDTGFNWYHDADPAEYDLIVANSEGGLAAARARREADRGCLLGRGPRLLPAVRRREGDRRLLLRVRRQVSPRVDAGARRRAVARAARRRLLARRPRLPRRHRNGAPLRRGAASQFARAISAARINLCITRRAHASVYASSSCRPFELASTGAAIVANPYEGIERWFEPGSELYVVSTTEQAIEAYRQLLDDPAQAAELGRRARSVCSMSTRTVIVRGSCSS